MKHLKYFENLNTNLDEVKTKIEYDYIQYFKNEDHYYDFCKEASNTDDINNIDWDYIPQDVIDELELEDKFPNVLLPELIDIITDVMSEIDLDECDDLRNLSYEDYKIKKLAGKYNL